MQRVSICSRKAGCATVSAGQPPLLVPPYPQLRALHGAMERGLLHVFGRARAPWGSASVPAPGSPARERPTAPAAGSRLPRGNRRPSDLP